MSQAAPTVAKKILQKLLTRSQTKPTTQPSSDITKLMDSESHEFKVVYSAHSTERLQRIALSLASTYGNRSQQQTVPQEQISETSELQRVQALIKRLQAPIATARSITRLRQMYSVKPEPPNLKDIIRQRDEQFKNWRIPLPIIGKWPTNIGDVGFIDKPSPALPQRERPDDYPTKPDPGDIVRRTLELPRIIPPPEVPPEEPKGGGRKDFCSSVDKNSAMYKQLCRKKVGVTLRG